MLQYNVQCLRYRQIILKLSTHESMIFAQQRALFNQWLRSYATNTLSIPDNVHYNTRISLGYIHQHIFDEDLTVSTVMHATSINSNTFYGTFKYDMGRSPHQYINHVRMKAAAMILRRSHPDIEIGCIAFEIGYARIRTFERSFIKTYCVSPSEYRRRHQSVSGGKSRA